MELQQYTAYTNDLLKRLSSNNSDFSLDPSVIEDIDRINRLNFVSPRIKETEFKANSGPNFKIPKAVSSIPFITDINDGDKITLKTIEPATYKQNANSRLSNRIVGINIGKFRDEINALNKAAFSGGLNLDSFQVINISNAPLNRESLKFLVSNGALLPLSSRHGVFIPEFALKDATYNSIEYESRFMPYNARTGKGLKRDTFKDMVTDPVKQDFGINVDSLFTHTHDNTLSYDLHTDGTIGTAPGTFTREVVLGAAPLSNLITATNAIFSSWNKRGGIREQDRIMDKSSGMHISTTLSGLIDRQSQKSASRYLNHAGIIIDALAKNKTRWNSTGHLGISNEYDDDRNDFRMQYSSQRLEHRYPGTIFDIGHVTDQLVMANKINSDVENYIKYSNSNIRQRDVVRFNVAFGGDAEKAASILSKLHNPGSPEHQVLNTWFNSFMDHIGITNEFSKSFVKSMNSRCLKA